MSPSEPNGDENLWTWKRDGGALSLLAPPDTERAGHPVAQALRHLTQIREELLRDAAIASLVRGEESVADLSERLGFSESSAFYRAFRRWTGSAPASYRPSPISRTARRGPCA